MKTLVVSKSPSEKWNCGRQQDFGGGQSWLHAGDASVCREATVSLPGNSTNGDNSQQPAHTFCTGKYHIWCIKIVYSVGYRYSWSFWYVPSKPEFLKSRSGFCVHVASLGVAVKRCQKSHPLQLLDWVKKSFNTICKQVLSRPSEDKLRSRRLPIARSDIHPIIRIPGIRVPVSAATGPLHIHSASLENASIRIANACERSHIGKTKLNDLAAAEASGQQDQAKKSWKTYKAQGQHFKRQKGQHSLALFCATGVPTTFQSHCETTLHYHCRQSWLLPVKAAFLTRAKITSVVWFLRAIRNIWSASIPGMLRVRSAACVWLKEHVQEKKVRGWYCLRIKCASLSHSQNHADICTRIILFLLWPWPFFGCSHRAPRETWISTVGAAWGVFCQSHYAA